MAKNRGRLPENDAEFEEDVRDHWENDPRRAELIIAHYHALRSEGQAVGDAAVEAITAQMDQARANIRRLQGN